MSQFLEVIEWLDESGTEIVHRVPEGGSGETKLGAQLVVRDSQAAIFFKSGRGLDVFGPGRHTLTTPQPPDPDEGAVAAVGLHQPVPRRGLLRQSQGLHEPPLGNASDPVVFRDRELGLVRLRAFGAFTMR